MKNATEFNRLVSGEGTRYEIIIRSLRKSLKAVIGEEDTKLGCISFYQGNPENGEVNLNVFPLDPEVINRNAPNDEKLKLEILSKINKPRAYSELHHLEHFRKNYDTEEHFILSIPENDRLNFNQKEVNGKKWQKFLGDKSNNDNMLDLVCFNSGQTMVNTISLPVLSSPCILITLPFASKRSIKEVILPIREVVDHYLITFIIQEIQKDLNLNSIESQEILVERFVQEFMQVSLPISYTLDGTKKMVFDWFGDKGGCTSDFTLNLDGTDVSFEFPTFCWENGELFHNTPLYESKKDQMKEMLESLFCLVLSNWRSLNSKKLIVEQDIQPIVKKLEQTLRSIDMKSLETQIEETKIGISHLTKSVSEINADSGQEMDNALYYTMKVKNGKQQKHWTFRCNGSTIFSNIVKEGFQELHYLIQESPRPIHIMEFFELEKKLITDNSIQDVQPEGSFSEMSLEFESEDTIGSDIRFDSRLEIQEKIKTIDHSYLKTKKDLETKIASIQRELDIESELDVLVDYAETVSSYIGFIKVQKEFYANKKEILNTTMVVIQQRMKKNEFVAFEKKIKKLEKSHIPSDLLKTLRDRYIARIKTTIKMCLEEKPDLNILKPNYMKIGSTSYFTPPPSFDNTWDLKHDC